MIHTERLILKPVSLEDAEFILELVNSKEYIENIGERNIRTLSEAQDYIQEKMVNHFKQHGYGNFLMTTKKDGAKIGCVSLYNRPDVDGVDIGFVLLHRYTKNGFAYEGAHALKIYAKETLGLSGITAFTTKENKDSQRLIEKLGLQFKKNMIFEDEKEELMLYGLAFDRK